MKRIAQIIFILLVFDIGTITAQNAHFNIAFLADVDYASNPVWISQIKKWGATGINLRIFMSNLFKGNQFNNTRWLTIKNCITNLVRKDNLDVFIRLNMRYINGADYSMFTDDDFQQTLGPKGPFVMLDQYNHIKVLNITSKPALDYRIRYFKIVINKLKEMDSDVFKKIKLIVPTISPDDETELMSSIGNNPNWGPYFWLSGFSASSQKDFINYLKNKYGNISNLNSTWEDSLSSFAGINLNKSDWQHIRKTYNYRSKGRKDFIDFLSNQLKKFVDTCAYITHKAGLKIGVQFGAVYGSGIEFKSYYDITPIVKNVDVILNDDVAQYSPDFNFGADYLRSVCNYWNWERKKLNKTIDALKFGTETNWPGYDYILPKNLVHFWHLQLKSYYDRGASYLFISQWGTDGMKFYWHNGAKIDTFIIGKLVENGTLDNENFEIRSTAYQSWKNILNRYKQFTVKNNIVHDTAVYLNPVLVLYSRSNDAPYYNIGHTHNIKFVVDSIKTFNGIDSGFVYSVEFPLYSFIKPKYPYNSDTNKYYNGKCDILTDYMMANSPDYFKTNYNVLYLTASSYFISDAAYFNLKHLDLQNKRIYNATWFLKNGHIEYEVTPGTKNDYDNYRIKNK